MENYSTNRKKHLCSYAEFKKLPTGGLFNGKQSQLAKLILLDRKQIEYNLLDGISLDLMPVTKLHQYAHHLSSSQILCYNYFRPMLDKDGHPTEELLNVISNKVTPIPAKVICQFEYDGYEHYSDEGTEFDFHVKGNDVEISFEIKYTEINFGKARNDDRHKLKFENTYSKMLKDCTCLKKNDITMDVFFKNYQLFRNVIRIVDKKRFSVFVFPKQHKKLKQAFENFKEKYISEEYYCNIKALYWEDLMKGKENTELYKKYFEEYSFGE